MRGGDTDHRFTLAALAVPPRAEQVAPGLGRYATAVASYFATGAALPPVPDPPRLRRGQLEQLKIALPWAFGLPRTRAARTGPVTAINTDQSFDQGVAQSAAL